MTAKMEEFQALLAQMRQDFISELPERCNTFDDLILKLEKQAPDQEIFNELFRGVHSLKGSGGTHGLNIITSICHQLENLLTETNIHKAFDALFVSAALAYVDLLRKVETEAERSNPNYAAIESALEKLRVSSLKSRKSVLIVDSSRLMTDMYCQALETLPLKFTVEESGLRALTMLLHEPFDLAIVGRELKELNGIGVMAALQVAQSRNHELPAILISSKTGAVPSHVKFTASILRDRHMANNLVKAVREILKI